MSLHEHAHLGSLEAPHEGDLRRLPDGSWEIWLLPFDDGTGAAERLLDAERSRRVNARLVVERRNGVDRVLAEVDGHRVGVAHRTVANRLVIALAGGPIDCAGRIGRCASSGGRFRLALAVTVPPGVITPGLG